MRSETSDPGGTPQHTQDPRIAEYRRQIKAVKQNEGRAHHRPAYRDLYLAATRMAEIKLHQCARTGAPLPRGKGQAWRWTDLLDTTMRARLRRAEVNPDDIDERRL